MMRRLGLRACMSALLVLPLLPGVIRGQDAAIDSAAQPPETASPATPADAKPADEKPADSKPADEKPADAKPADAKPADAKPADEKPADEKPADEKPADEKPADAKPADEKPADAKPADEKPADEKPADAKPVEKPAAAPSVPEFETVLAEWKGVLKDLRELKVRYQAAPESELDAMQQQWRDLVAKGQELLPTLGRSALVKFRAAPNQDRFVTRFLVKLALDYVKQDRYDEAGEIVTVLLAEGVESPQLSDAAGKVAFVNNQYDEAEKYFKEAQAGDALSQEAQAQLAAIPECKELWKKELAARDQDATENLPRVKLATNVGDIVVELFEREAPDTVGNFISLVEKKFYDELTFHRVIPQFMAQGGCPRGDGTGDAGYNIFCECYKEEHRNHFRGSLSMAHAGRDTGGSQFYLTFVPTPHLNGRHTVFGRVIEGMDVLAKLQRRDPTGENPPEPSRIITAEVLRKDPNKKYEPKKVP